MDIYHVCRVAIAPLRAAPSDAAEIVSQVLFGDRVVLLELTEKWCKVRTHHDNYEGWMDHRQLHKISELQYFDEKNYQYLTPASFDNRVVDKDGAYYYLSAGSTLPFYKDGYCYIGENGFEVLSTPVVPQKSSFESEVEKIAMFFLNSPYLWGGRSLFGIDCSGFVQTVYKIMGIQLPRDASQQVDKGETVDFLASAKLGDLAFFDNVEGRITHVGLMLSNDKIIHSSGMVRIDPIDDQGIYNAELEKYTHKLRIIKRFV